MPGSNKFILFSIFNGIAVIACAVFLITALNSTSSADTNAGSALPISKGGTSANTGPEAIINLGIYPIGSLYFSTTNVNPGTYLGGTWEAYGTGRTIVGVNPVDTLMDVAEETFGVADAVVPYHNHTTNIGHYHWTSLSYDGNDVYVSYTPGAGITTRTRTVRRAAASLSSLIFNDATNTTREDSTSQAVASGTLNVASTFQGTSGNATNANYQPSIATYIWKRTN